MTGQRTENLFRRFKGQSVSIKTISGGVYQGEITEVTNDYVSLMPSGAVDRSAIFLFFNGIESLSVGIAET